MRTEKTLELRQAIRAAAQILQQRPNPEVSATHKRLQLEYLQSLGKTARPTNGIEPRQIHR